MVFQATMWSIQKEMNSRFLSKEKKEDEVFELIKETVAHWVSSRKELKDMTSTNNMYHWEPATREGPTRKQIKICWHAAQELGRLKFNVNDAAGEKPRPTGIGGVLRSKAGGVLLSFLRYSGFEGVK